MKSVRYEVGQLTQVAMVVSIKIDRLALRTMDSAPVKRSERSKNEEMGERGFSWEQSRSFGSCRR